MKIADPTPLDRLIYRRIGPHLVHTFDGDNAVMRKSDHQAARVLQALRRKARTRRLS